LEQTQNLDEVNVARTTYCTKKHPLHVNTLVGATRVVPKFLKQKA